MQHIVKVALSACLTLCPLLAVAQEANAPKPIEILKNAVVGMPVAGTQEIRVLTATIAPQQTTIRHTHRFPVTTYVLQGSMTFALKDQPAVTVKAGEAFVEAPNTPITGANESATDEAKVVIFYVSDPATPFLDPIK